MPLHTASNAFSSTLSLLIMIQQKLNNLNTKLIDSYHTMQESIFIIILLSLLFFLFQVCILI